MKKIIINMLGIIILCSCQKSKTEAIIPAGTDQITMKINGVAWSGMKLAGFVQDETLVINSINAATKETLGSVVAKVTGIGTFKVKATGNTLTYSKNTDTYSGFDDGTVTVTALKTNSVGAFTASGTFKGTFIHTKTGEKLTITEGKF